MPDSFKKAMTEPVKVMAPMATPSDISMRLAKCDGAALADAEAVGRIERGGGDEHGGEADQRVECGDQLRHRRHGDAPRGDGADEAADAEAAADQISR